MNCTRVEKLLPLHAGDDLGDPRERAAVATHLAFCADCRLAAARWAESRRLLRLHEPPEFDADFFDGIRGAVLREISKAPAPSPLAALLARLYGRRALAYAAAAGALVIFAGALALRFQSARLEPGPVAQRPVAAESPAPSPLVAAPLTVGPSDRQPVPAPKHENAASDNRRVFRRRQAPPAHARVPGGGSTEAARRRDEDVQVAVLPPRPSDPVNGSGASAPRGATRIELQTGDPNVRIIWLTPQTADAPVQPTQQSTR